MNRAGLVIVVGLGVLAPRVALANFWDLYGYSPRALALANSMTAMSDDFTAVYYNPAALTAGESQSSFGAGISATRPSLSLRFDKEARAIEELEPPNATQVTFGATFPLGWRTGTRHRAAMGLGISVPTRSLLNGQALDPAIPHWYQYQANPERLLAQLGLGVRPVDWLALGMGVQFLAGLEGLVDYELDIVSGRFVKKTVRFDINPRAAPSLGLEVRPLSGLRVGVSYRAAIEVPVSLPVKLKLTGLADLDVGTDFVVQYQPHQVAIGASYLYEPFGLTASGELVVALWSNAPDPSVEARIDAGGELLEGTGLAGAIDAPAVGQERRVDLAFRNVVIPRIGVEKVIEDFTLRAGWSVRPSPAPVQTSGTNYVDGTAHSIGAGVGVGFVDPFGLFSEPLELDLAASLVILPSRRHEKIDPADPVGSYTASGTILVLGAALKYTFVVERKPDERSKE